MPSVLVAGGGLAGLAAAAALGGAGYDVTVFESRSFLGGRATSYPTSTAEGPGEIIDNCQHVLLRCCVNLLDFYTRLGVRDLIRFYREFYFLEPGGRTSILKAGGLPQPLHFTLAFLKMQCFSFGEKLALAQGLLSLKAEYRTRRDLDSITMLAWLREKKQPQRAIDRFWNPVLVSAINEELDTMAAAHGFQVFWLGFLARPDSYEMGIPSVPLGRLYGPESWTRIPKVSIRLKSGVDHISGEGLVSGGETLKADYYVSALPYERLEAVTSVMPPTLESSPITGIHLWFDRCVTSLPHASLLDRTIQWMFNKDGGRYIQLVVSASRSLVPLSKSEVVELAVRELAEFFPDVTAAKLMKSHVVKEIRATFSARTGLEKLRPTAHCDVPNLFLAGDWTRSGWPATMEGAVRSGYHAAEAVTRAAGKPLKFVLPDVG